MVRSLNFFALSALALCAPEICALAGDKEVSPPERKEFHLAIEYPFVFRPASYLLAQGPAPMRYGQPAEDLADRSAPPLPAAARGSDKQKQQEKNAASQPSPSPNPQAQATPAPKDQNGQQVRILTEEGPVPAQAQAQAPAAAYPVPENAPTPVPKGEADFGKTPDEVEGYFRNQYNFVPDSHRFFDPIFEPAVAPQEAQMGPKSTATYSETP